MEKISENGINESLFRQRPGMGLPPSFRRPELIQVKDELQIKAGSSGGGQTGVSLGPRDQIGYFGLLFSNPGVSSLIWVDSVIQNTGDVFITINGNFDCFPP